MGRYPSHNFISEGKGRGQGVPTKSIEYESENSSILKSPTNPESEYDWSRPMNQKQIIFQKQRQCSTL